MGRDGKVMLTKPSPLSSLVRHRANPVSRSPSSSPLPKISSALARSRSGASGAARVTLISTSCVLFLLAMVLVLSGARAPHSSPLFGRSPEATSFDLPPLAREQGGGEGLEDDGRQAHLTSVAGPG